MFVFKPTEKTYSDPSSAIFVPGIPFGFEYSKGDICFFHEELLGSKMFFNSRVLRQAILDSKEFLEEILELKIEDAKEPEEVKEDVVVEEATKPEETPEATPDESTDEVEAPTNEEAPEETPTDEPATDEPFMFEEADIPVKEEKKSNKKK